MQQAQAKTRNLSVAEYFVAIQKEYLIAEFRKKIYYNPADKNYYGRVMRYKAEKINCIANRNKLASILNSEEKMKEVKKELFDMLGRPCFELNEKDKENYYAVGNEFSFMGEIWFLDQVNEDDTLTLYSSKQEKYIKAYKKTLCRIL